MDNATTKGAELVVSAPTVEGDPIVTYYRVLPGGGVEIFVDSTLDEFGGDGAGWSLQRCPPAVEVFGYDHRACTGKEL
jgi:hypothetical protein